MWDWFRTPSTFYHGPDVSRARSSRHPVGIWLTDSLTHHLTEQTRTNMSQPGRRTGTVVGNEQHVLQALWSKKKILTLRGGLWVCPVLALVKACPVRNSYWFLRLSESDSEDLMVFRALPGQYRNTCLILRLSEVDTEHLLVLKALCVRSGKPPSI